MSITTAIPKDGHARPADRGFDFLGYRFSSLGLLGVAVQTVVRCVERMNRFYEQGADNVRIRDCIATLDGIEPAQRKSRPQRTARLFWVLIGSATLCRPSSPSPSVGEQADGTDAEQRQGAGFWRF